MVSLSSHIDKEHMKNQQMHVFHCIVFHCLFLHCIALQSHMQLSQTRTHAYYIAAKLLGDQNVYKAHNVGYCMDK